MKMIISEKRFVTNVEYAYYEVEIPEDMVKLYKSEDYDDQDEFNDWLNENYYEDCPFDYEGGDTIDVQTESWEIDKIEE